MRADQDTGEEIRVRGLSKLRCEWNATTREGEVTERERVCGCEYESEMMRLYGRNNKKLSASE